MEKMENPNRLRQLLDEEIALQRAEDEGMIAEDDMSDDEAQAIIDSLLPLEDSPAINRGGNRFSD